MIERPLSLGNVPLVSWEKEKNDSRIWFVDQKKSRWQVVHRFQGGVKKVYVLMCQHQEEKAFTCLCLPKTSSSDGENKWKVSRCEREDIEQSFLEEAFAWSKVSASDGLPIAKMDAFITYKGLSGASRFGAQMLYYLKGDLLEYISDIGETKAMSRSFIEDIASQILTILKKLWDKRIVHKDVKPENFLIKPKEGNKELIELVIADFGFAVLEADSDHKKDDLKEFAGSPEYISPEVLFQLDALAVSREQGALWLLKFWREEELEGESSPRKPRVFPEKIDVFSCGIILLLMIPYVDSTYKNLLEIDEEYAGSNFTFFLKQLNNYHACAKKLEESGDPFYLLVKDLLAFNPANRPSAEEALERLHKLTKERQ